MILSISFRDEFRFESLKKTTGHTQQELNLSRLCRAIGHPVRIEILSKIASKGECVRGEIIEVESLASSTVIQHLRELKKVGLIKGRIFGSGSCYCINWEQMDEFVANFEEFANFMNTAISRESEC